MLTVFYPVNPKALLFKFLQGAVDTIGFLMLKKSLCFCLYDILFDDRNVSVQLLRNTDGN